MEPAAGILQDSYCSFLGLASSTPSSSSPSDMMPALEAVCMSFPPSVS